MSEINRQDFEKKRQEAKRNLQDFIETHGKILEEMGRLSEEVAKYQWPPRGFYSCSGEDEDGTKCSNTCEQKQDLPEGWTEKEVDSGRGWSYVFFCPKHSDKGK